MSDLSQIVFLRHGRYGQQLACDETVSALIRQSINDGTYEWPGGLRLLNIVRDGDRVLELGGGLGCLASLVCSSRTVASYSIIEADARLHPLILRTLEINGIHVAKAHHLVLTDEAEALDRGYADFYRHGDFWASSTRRVQGSQTWVRVPVRSLSEWISGFRPDVIHCDIEGAEDGLFTKTELDGVRALTIELHHDVIPPETEDRLGLELGAKGFECDSGGAVGNVLVFRRY